MTMQRGNQGHSCLQRVIYVLFLMFIRHDVCLTGPGLLKILMLSLTLFSLFRRFILSCLSGAMLCCCSVNVFYWLFCLCG